jgi:hypothetical protein
MLVRRVCLAASGALVALTLAGCPAEETPSANLAPSDDGVGAAPDGDTPDQPAPPPAPKPFDRATAKTPWKLCKKGDWAVYKMHSANKTLRFDVTAVEGNTVKFTVKDDGSGELMQEAEIDLQEEEGRYKDPMTYDALAKDKDGNEIKPYAEAVEIKGKKIEALVVKRSKDGMGSTELWLAEKDIPPFNQCAVKSIRNGKLELEVVDFGRGE